MFTPIVPNTVQWEDCAILCLKAAWDFHMAGTVFCIFFPKQSECRCFCFQKWRDAWLDPHSLLFMSKEGMCVCIFIVYFRIFGCSNQFSGEVGFGCAPFPWRVQCPHPNGAIGRERKGAAGSPRDDGDGWHNYHLLQERSTAHLLLLRRVCQWKWQMPVCYTKNLDKDRELGKRVLAGEKLGNAWCTLGKRRACKQHTLLVSVWWVLEVRGSQKKHLVEAATSCCGRGGGEKRVSDLMLGSMLITVLTADRQWLCCVLLRCVLLTHTSCMAQRS